MSDTTQGRSRPSIYDVAKRAGVSHMTVSRVLNGHPNIRAATRERVLEAISEMNYTRSSVARALASRRTMKIGVLVDRSEQFGPNSTLRALEDAARGAGYTISIFSITEAVVSSLEAGLAELWAQGVDGLCVIAPRASSLALLREHDTGLPTVVITAEPDERWRTAAVDQRAGARLATEHLLDLGHRRIAHLAGPLDWHDAREREEGWREALQIAGLESEPAMIGDWTSDSGYEVGTTLDATSVTAVFVSNDQMALGLVHGLSDRGIRVPEEVSVVGFDDIPDARHYLPPLTTVRQDFAALGERAVNLVIAALDGESVSQHDSIAAQLIVRSSTSSPAR